MVKTGEAMSELAVVALVAVFALLLIFRQSGKELDVRERGGP